MYSIKAVSQLTGLTVEIIRAWERRYQAVVPQRDHNDRRVYGTDEIKRLHLLKKATDLGHTIGKVASLEENELNDLFKRSGGNVDFTHYKNKLRRDMLAAVENYDVIACDNVLGLAMRSMSPMELINDFLSPALIDVGDLWHRGEMTVANERILSSAVRRLLISVMQTYQKVALGKSLVIGTLSGEHHEIGCLFCAFLSASLGYHCYYMGPDLPAEDFVRVAEKSDAHAIVISIVSLIEGQDYIKQLKIISEEINPNVNVWIGGDGALQLADEYALPDKCELIYDISDFKDKLNYLSVR